MKQEDHAKQPSERERLEARVLAMLLGECDDEEQTTVEDLLSKSPELQAYRESAERRLDLLREATHGKVALESEPLQLDPERHRELEELLTRGSTGDETDKITPFEPSSEPSETEGERKWTRFLPFGAGAAVVAGAAAAAVAGIVIIVQSSWQQTDSPEDMALAEKDSLQFETAPVFQPKGNSQQITLKQREQGTRNQATIPPKSPEQSLDGEDLGLAQMVSEIDMPDLAVIAEAETLAKQEELAALEPRLADEVAQASGAILDKRVANDINALNEAFSRAIDKAPSPAPAKAKADGQVAYDNDPTADEGESADRKLALADFSDFKKRTAGGGAGYSTGKGASRSAIEADHLLARDSTRALRSIPADVAPPPALAKPSLGPVPSASKDEPVTLESIFLAQSETPVVPLAPPLEEKTASDPPAPIGIASSIAFNESQELAEKEESGARKAQRKNSPSSESTKETLDAVDLLAVSDNDGIALAPHPPLPSATAARMGFARRAAPFARLAKQDDILSRGISITEWRNHAKALGLELKIFPVTQGAIERMTGDAGIVDVSSETKQLVVNAGIEHDEAKGHAIIFDGSQIIAINTHRNLGLFEPLLKKLGVEAGKKATPPQTLKLIVTGPIKLLYVKPGLNGQTAKTFRNLEKGDERELVFRESIEGAATSIENLKLEVNGKQFGFQLTGAMKFRWPQGTTRK